MLYDPKWEVKVKQDEKWRQILLDAAALLEKCPHWKGGPGQLGSACAITAIYRIGGKEAYPAARRLEDAVGCYVPAWNDAPSTTKEMVIAKMREVASR